MGCVFWFHGDYLISYCVWWLQTCSNEPLIFKIATVWVLSVCVFLKNNKKKQFV